MKYIIEFFLLFAFFSFTCSSFAAEESLEEEEKIGRISPFDFCEDIMSEQKLSELPTSISFPFLLDMGIDIVLEAFSFITNCNFSSHGGGYIQETIKKYQEDIYFISLGRFTKETIIKNEDYHRVQYIFITLQNDVLDAIKMIRDFKRELNLSLNNQVKLIMFSPSDLNNTKVRSYSEQINRKNIISFNLQYNWYNFQISRSVCPLGVSIDIPHDKHNKGFRLSRLNPVDTCIDPSQSLSDWGFLKETLREIYEKALHKWNFRMDAIENGMFKDENEILNKMGIYSSDPLRTGLLAFFGGYES